MGGALSSPESASSAESKSLESLLTSVGILPSLRIIFSHISAKSSRIHSENFREFFGVCIRWTGSEANSSNLRTLIQNLAPCLVDIFIEKTENGVTWLSLLRGFEKCHQPAAAGKLKLLFSFWYKLIKISELPLYFSVGHGDGNISDVELSGHVSLGDLRDLLWLCWIMNCDAEFQSHKNSEFELPNVEPLVKSAQLACSNSSNEDSPENIPVDKLYKWMLVSIPVLAGCLWNSIQAQLHRSASKIQGQNISKSGTCSEVKRSLPDTGLLTSGIAWAIGLSQPDAVGYKLMHWSFSLWEDNSVQPLYRSSMHGKGMNRFWAHLEGYQATSLMLIEGITVPAGESPVDSESEAWLVGALLKDGFENKSGYYGSRGSCIFALQPVMQPFRSTGNGSNYVYSCSNTVTNKNYLQQQRQTGIGFGGDFGKERLWLDDDFMHLTVRHHAMDKTFEAGYLLPNQGYGTVQARVLNVEVLGLGGAAALENQMKYQERMNLFTGQKRKVDLQSLAAGWANSPEKMMMDMVSNPNKPEKEER